MPYLINIMVTRKCNMVCSYCYEDKNSYKIKDELMMTKENAQDILDFIKVNVKEIDYPLTINFHGGEPLLNMEIIKYMVNFLKKNAIPIITSITTNGTLLTDDGVINLLNEIDYVSISIDGDKETFTKNRKIFGNKTSYEQILEIAIELNKTHKNGIRIRSTVDINTVDKLVDNYIFFTNNLFKTVVVSLNYYNSNWTTDKIKILLESIDTIRELYRNLDETYSTNLLSKETIVKSVCTVGNNYFNIDYNGDLYPCTALLGDKDHIIGNVNTGIDRKKIDSLCVINNEKISDCSDCRIYEYCSNVRCKFVNKSITGCYNKPHSLKCIMEKKLFSI